MVEVSPDSIPIAFDNTLETNFSRNAFGSFAIALSDLAASSLESKASNGLDISGAVDPIEFAGSRESVA